MNRHSLDEASNVEPLNSNKHFDYKYKYKCKFSFRYAFDRAMVYS